MTRDRLKSWLKNFVAIVFGLIVSLILCEIILRVYNPFSFRVKGDRIILPVNKSERITNAENPKLDSVIVNSKNGIGFRGPEMPKNFSEYTSLIAIGGSTTACFYLSDGKDWPAQLNKELGSEISNVWVNNAGMEGHSTFGHQILLDDFIVELKPDYALFLVGCNDVARDDLNTFDKHRLVTESSSFMNWLDKHSELVGLAVNLQRNFKARNRQLTHFSIDLESQGHVGVDQKEIDKELEKHRSTYLESYRRRLNSLVETSQAAGIIPILITQPTLVGEGIDETTRINLETIEMSKLNGKAYWQTLELYNDVTREIGRTKAVQVIDLANKLPKNSLYFYDTIHFTNEGASEVGKIIASEFLLMNPNL